MRTIRNGLLAAAVLSFTTAGAARAQVSVGMPNNGQANCLPFGCPTGHQDTQQIYAASAFSGPINIGALTFYNTRGTGNFAAGTFMLYLSTTTASPTAPGATPAANVTSPQQLFATFVSTGAAAPTSFTFVGTPFLYDPSAGNLLLDVRNAPIGFSLAPQAFFDVVMTAQVGRTTDTSPFLGSDTRGSYGLVTTFTPAAITTPEPGVVALVGAGLFGLAAVARRRRVG